LEVIREFSPHFENQQSNVFFLYITNNVLNRWEKAGKIWWETMLSGQIPAKCKFIQFADVTVDKAEELFGDEAAAIVRKAWNDVGVVRKSHL
jgi:Zn-dependent metalloprotease